MSNPSPMAKPLPVLKSPPVMELVLGVQFSPIVSFTSGHAGWFWKKHLSDDWTGGADAPQIGDQFERFDTPKRSSQPALMLRLEPTAMCPRFQVTSATDDRMIQVQPTRFHFNWRRREHSYPSYGTVVSEFEIHFAAFRRFADEAGFGPLLLNQWEITYLDRVPQGDLWQTPADWHRVFPGLFAPLPSLDGVTSEHFGGEWVFEIIPKFGRLHVSARHVHDDDGIALLIETTARGPLGRTAGPAELRVGLDTGHRIAVDTFFQFASQEAIRTWERSR